MESDVYTVPSEVLFRNSATTVNPQVRNLLVKNNTSQTLQTVISYPFSSSFRLQIPADQHGELKATPPHLVLELQPNSTGKVVVALNPSESSGKQDLQDVLVVLFGGLRVLRVPVRAACGGGVEGAAPGAAAATRAQQHQQDLDARCSDFVEQVRALYGDALALREEQQQQPQEPAGTATSPADNASGTADRGLSGSTQAAVTDDSGQRQGAVGRAEVAIGDGLGDTVGGAAESTGGPMMAAARKAATATAAAALLPPEGFSQPQTLPSGEAGDVEEPVFGGDGDADDGGTLGDATTTAAALQQQTPVVLHKTIKVQGRAAVAVPAAADVAQSFAATANDLPLTIRTSSSGVGVARPVSASSSVSCSGTSAAAAAGGGRLAFLVNGQLVDARGCLLEASALQPGLLAGSTWGAAAEAAGLAGAAAAGGSVTVVDCGEVVTPRMSRSGSGISPGLTPPRMATPPPGSSSAAAAASPSPAAMPLPTTSPALSNGLPSTFAPSSATASPGGGRVSLAPLKHGGVPVTAALRPGSAASSSPLPAVPSSSVTALGRPPIAPLGTYSGGAAGSGSAAAAAGGAGSGSGGEDPLRTAALAAAMRELGITDLPAPSPSGRKAAAAGADWLRPPSATAAPSYVQYGLPPNYRPSSGSRRKPAAAAGSAAAAAVGAAGGTVGRFVVDDPLAGDDDDEGAGEPRDDADLEARLQQQIESNVLRSTGPAAAAGPGPAPVLRPKPMARAPGAAGTASPGAYLPPRAGAASSGGLGAPSAAAAAAAAVAAGARLGRATAAAAAATGGLSTRRPAAAAVDSDYPEEFEFEAQLQRQIDRDVANGGGGGGGGAGGSGRSPAGGGGGGARWRGSAGGGGGSGAAAAGGSRVTPASSGLKRSNSAASTGSMASSAGGGRGSSNGSGSGGATAVAGTAGGSGVAGVRRLSADSAAAEKAAAAARARVAGAGAASAAAPHVASTGATKGGRSEPAQTAAKTGPVAGTAAAAAAKGAAGRGGGVAGSANVQRMKANWDALG